MIKKLTSSEIGEVYNDILMFGSEGLKGLELKQIIQIGDHARQIEKHWINIAVSWLSASINHCPDEFKDGREVEWFLSTKPDYQASLKVLKIIADYWNPQLIEKKTEHEAPKTLSGLITHTNNVEIVQRIKIEYKGIKGKQLKLLLMAFQELGLLPKERFGKRFHDCCKNEFDWYIATYNAMNGHKYNEHIDKDELDSIKIFLERLTKTK